MERDSNIRLSLVSIPAGALYDLEAWRGPYTGA